MESDKYKILIVYDVSYPSIDGGGQRRLYEVAKRLIDNDIADVDWICFKTWDIEGRNKLHPKINYIGLPGFKGLYNKSGSRRILEPLEFLYSLFRHKPKLYEYDIIWSGQWPILHLIFWSFNKKVRNKLVVDWWEYWGKTWFSYSKFVGFIGYFFEKILLLRLTKFSKLVSISKISNDQIKEYIKFPRNLYLVNNGIDARELNIIGNTASKVYSFGYLGRLKDHKRVDLLIRAIHWIEVTHNIRLSLVIIGDGPERERLEELAKELKIKNRIDFRGSIKSNDEVYKILAKSEIFVNPSTKEGGGSITLFEAFALGLPSVAFKCDDGIDPSLIGDMRRGVLVREVSYKALGESLFKLSQDKNTKRSMSNKAIEFSRDYDWDIISKKYNELFELINKK